MTHIGTLGTRRDVSPFYGLTLSLARIDFDGILATIIAVGDKGKTQTTGVLSCHEGLISRCLCSRYWASEVATATDG